MKRLTLILASLLLAPALLAWSAPADARGRWRSGFYLNFVVPWPSYYYWGPHYGYYGGYPYSYYPSPVIVEREGPITYVERSDTEGSSESAQSAAAPIWWYWCAGEQRYYPYVRECPSGWQRVPPQAKK
jgi:hypothetical protein